MGKEEVRWRTNLRTNLLLWPEVAPNVATLVKAAGGPYDEAELLKRFTADGDEEEPNAGGKAPTDARVVRNTYEVLALAGLVHRSGTPEKLLLTPLGHTVFSFLGVVGEKRFANEKNITLIGEGLACALSLVTEYRAIWGLMRLCDDHLTNEELNRAMKRIRVLSDVSAAAQAVREAREQNDVTRIGPRIYEDDKYADEGKRSGQRRALNPLFLLAGGGGTIITLTDDSRSLRPDMVGVVQRLLDEPHAELHADTSSESALSMSHHSGLPMPLWTDL